MTTARHTSLTRTRTMQGRRQQQHSRARSRLLAASRQPRFRCNTLFLPVSPENAGYLSLSRKARPVHARLAMERPADSWMPHKS